MRFAIPRIFDNIDLKLLPALSQTLQVAEWSKSFSPGRLYTMGRLTRGER